MLRLHGCGGVGPFPRLLDLEPRLPAGGECRNNFRDDPPQRPPAFYRVSTGLTRNHAQVENFQGNRQIILHLPLNILDLLP